MDAALLAHRLACAMSVAERLCHLARLAGRVEVCTADCPLWENGKCSLQDAEFSDEPWEENEAAGATSLLDRSSG